jgi:hypothetical protein
VLDRMIGDAFEHLAKIIFRIELVEPSGSQSMPRRPPESEPANNQFFRLCTCGHKRNYVQLRIMRSRTLRYPCWASGTLQRLAA